MLTPVSLNNFFASSGVTFIFPEWDYEPEADGVTYKLIYHYIGAISGISGGYSKIEQCENRAKILMSKAVASKHPLFYFNISAFSYNYDTLTIQNCTNTGNITIDSCQIDEENVEDIEISIFGYKSVLELESVSTEKRTNNTNKGNINITNNKFIKTNKDKGINIYNTSDKFINTGYITVDNNTNMAKMMIFQNYIKSMNECKNYGHITITNNKLDDGFSGNILGVNLIATSFSNCVNNGDIVIDNNSENYNIKVAKNIYGSSSTEGYTNNGKVTVNKVEGEISN